MKKILNWDVGVAEALTLVFVAEKLAGFTSWPWLYVLAPMWVPYGWRFVTWLGSALIEYGKFAVETKKVNKEEAHDRLVGIGRSEIN